MTTDESGSKNETETARRRRSPTGKLKKSISHLERETKKLKDEQGRVARRNARRNVLEALRSVRSALDAEYPVEKKESAKRRKQSKGIPANFSEIQPNTVRFGQLLKAGIRLKHIAPTNKPEDDTTTRNRGRWYGPTWAVFAPPDTTIEQFKKARRSTTERDALATLGRLWREENRLAKRMRADAKEATFLMNYGADTEKLYAAMQEKRANA
jgi:hypothetical protein